MNSTAHRAKALAEVASHFALLGSVSADEFLETVALELGHAEILDGFRPYGPHFSKAIPSSTILHIVSGNTPHAALQSLLRGLLLGAHNLVKLPNGGLPEVDRFVSLLPDDLRRQVVLSEELPDDWLRQARAWVVFGRDETISHFRALVGPDVLLEAHPHRVSLGLVFADPHGASARHAARDASLFDQRGCLSPHDFYVQGDARNYAATLAVEMARQEAINPRGPLTPSEAAEIHSLRTSLRFRAASDPRVQLWESDGNTAWTVIYEEDPAFTASCLNRVVYVKPLPADLPTALGPARTWVGAIGIWPATPDHAEIAATLTPSRICPLGTMQDPPWTWHQEGRQTLAPFVRWVDFESDLR